MRIPLGLVVSTLAYDPGDPSSILSSVHYPSGEPSHVTRMLERTLAYTQAPGNQLTAPDKHKNECGRALKTALVYSKFSCIHSLSIPLYTYLRSFLVSTFRLEALRCPYSPAYYRTPWSTADYTINGPQSDTYNIMLASFGTIPLKIIYVGRLEYARVCVCICKFCGVNETCEERRKGGMPMNSFDYWKKVTLFFI
jgi:hypothetical protein